MSKYIAKYMNLEKSKRPTFWNGWSNNLPRHDMTIIRILESRVRDREYGHTVI